MRFPGPLGSVGQVPGGWISPYQGDAAVVSPVRVAYTKPTPPQTAPISPDHAKAVVRAAEYFLDHAPEGFNDDCSGFVCAVYDRAGSPVAGSVKMLWERAELARATHSKKLPNVGDLAFFDNTYDRDHNGKTDDRLTHIAIVVGVDRVTGQIDMAHGGSSQGRTTLTMNLLYPDEHYDEGGEKLNDYLRQQKTRDPHGTQYLASQLWVGFATVRDRDLEIWQGLNDATSDAQ